MTLKQETDLFVDKLAEGCLSYIFDKKDDRAIAACMLEGNILATAHVQPWQHEESDTLLSDTVTY